MYIPLTSSFYLIFHLALFTSLPLYVILLLSSSSYLPLLFFPLPFSTPVTLYILLTSTSPSSLSHYSLLYLYILVLLFFSSHLQFFTHFFIPSRILHTSSSVHPHHLFIPILSSLSHYSLLPMYAILLLSSPLHLPSPILLHSSTPVHHPHHLFILLHVSLLSLCFTSSCKARISASMSNQAEVW